MERAVNDNDEYPRGTALEILAEKWHDEITREFIMARAVEDSDEDLRIIALEVLVKKWKDETTQKFIMIRAYEDEEVREKAFRLLINNFLDKNDT